LGVDSSVRRCKGFTAERASSPAATATTGNHSRRPSCLNGRGAQAKLQFMRKMVG